jgi:Tol biopolymer transport system component
VALGDVADGRHTVVIVSRGRIVAYAIVVKPGERVARGPGVAVAHEGHIYVGGTPIARGSQPAWSPDGSRVAFVRDGLIFVADRDGSDVRRLTRREPGLHWPGRYPDWSPDGTRIAFSGTRDLFTVAVADGRLTALMEAEHSWLVSTQPAYSPDGRTIAFARAVDASSSAIFLVDADGSDLRRLTAPGPRGRLGKTVTPTWSPDGRTIVFAANREGNYELYAIDRSGGSDRRLTTTPDVDEQSPRFSPDGSRLLYADDGRIATMRLDGADVRELGAGTAADWR